MFDDLFIPTSAGETLAHKRLKREACRWLWKTGYRCIAAEVALRPLGIIDAVGTGFFPGMTNYLHAGKPLYQTCFIECKASRADFTRDLTNTGQMELAMFERKSNSRRKKRGRRTLRQRVGLGKFAACLMQPMANLHYILAPQGVLTKADVPARWGLLTLGDGGISVVVKPVWQEQSTPAYVESAIAYRLTSDIYRADQRALDSVNRELLQQQLKLAQRLRDNLLDRDIS